MSVLIILRGNSGSGKSTVAQALQKHCGPNTLLIEQDKVRIEMLRTKDRENNLAIQLIKEIALYGAKHCEVTIIEGILSPERYKAMLMEVMAAFPLSHHVYYFDIPFEETVRRHATREKSNWFTEEDMRPWWKDKNFLDVPNEKVIYADSTLEETVQRIIREVNEKIMGCAKG